MKTPRLLALIAAVALFFTAPLHLTAAEVSVDVSSFAPRDPDAVIQQIELNVLLKQYEKLLTQIEDSRLEYELARLDSSLTDAQKKQSDERMEGKKVALGQLARNCRGRIDAIVVGAQHRAKAIEEEKAAEKAKQTRLPTRNPV